MSLLALAYPVLRPEDFEWIQSVRHQHDPHYTLLDPHVTLVFEVDGMDLDTFISHVRPIVEATPEISFVMKCVSVVSSVYDENWYMLMVPDEGYSDIVKFHDRLYVGALRKHLRLDIPFIPHITTGIFKEPEPCKDVVDELNRSEFAISGRLATVDIVSYENDRIETLEKIELSGNSR